MRTVILTTLNLFFLSSSVMALTLEDVYDARSLKCGVTTGQLNFSAPDTQNNWQGFEVDLCRALASIIFGSTKDDYIDIVPLTSGERIEAVSTGKVHILAAQQPWNWYLEARTNLTMIGPYFYDGQGLLVHNDSGIRSIWNIQNKNICVVAESNHEVRLQRHLHRLRYPTKLVLYPTQSDMFRGFETGACDAMTTNVTELFVWRQRLASPQTTQLVPQLLSKRPIGFVVPDSDREWPILIKLFLNGLIAADELGVNSTNIALADTGSSDIIDFINFGENEIFSPLSSNNWVQDVIENFGSYREIYLRYFGPDSLTPFPEGVHRLWSVGGLVYGEPIY